jgi:hypothetical protein
MGVQTTSENSANELHAVRDTPASTSSDSGPYRGKEKGTEIP